MTRVMPDSPECQFAPLYYLTGTVVLLVASSQQYWYSSYFKPGVHYVPIKVVFLEFQKYRMIYLM